MANEDKMAALAMIQGINAVDGFDPAPLAMEYFDLNTNEKRLRLPVMVQLAWFRLKYPEGRIAVSATPTKDYFVATARVYRNCADPVEHFLAEATASRGALADKPTVSPREWAQTAAIGIALRNAGFGLQFGAAGDAFDTPAVNEFDGILWSPLPSENTPGLGSEASSVPSAASAAIPPSTVQDTESPLDKALKVKCPIKKHKSKTLGEVLREDPGAINWIATKYTGDADIVAAAKLLCEESLKATA